VFRGSHSAQVMPQQKFHRGFHGLKGALNPNEAGTSLAFLETVRGLNIMGSLKTLLSLSALSLFLLACGSPEDETVIRDRTQGDTSNVFSYFLDPMPRLYIAFDRGPNDLNDLVRVIRQRPLHEFHVTNLAQASSYTGHIESVVTGMTISARDRNDCPLKIYLAMVGREVDTDTGLFSRSTRIFADANQGYDTAQEFVIKNEDNPNIALTGFGARLREGTITKLGLQRKALSSIDSSGGVFSEGQVTMKLPPGWVAIGFYIRFKIDTAQYEAKKCMSTKVDYKSHRVPFIEDAIFDSAQIAVE